MQQRVNSELATHARNDIHSGERQLLDARLEHLPNVGQSVKGKDMKRKQRTTHDRPNGLSTAMDQTADSNDQGEIDSSQYRDSQNGRLNRASNQVESDGQLLNRQKYIAKSSLTDFKKTSAAHKSNFMLEDVNEDDQVLAFDNGSRTEMLMQKQREIDRILAAQHFDDAQKRILVRKAQRFDSLTSPVKRPGGKYPNFPDKKDNRYQKPSVFEHMSGKIAAREQRGMKTPKLSNTTQMKQSRPRAVHAMNALALSQDHRKVNTPAFNDQDGILLGELDELREGYINRNNLKARQSQNESNLDHILFPRSKKTKQANLNIRLKSPTAPSKSPKPVNRSQQNTIKGQRLPSIKEKQKASRFGNPLADRGNFNSSGPIEALTSPSKHTPGRIRSNLKLPQNEIYSSNRGSVNLAQSKNNDSHWTKVRKEQPSGMSNTQGRSTQGSQAMSKAASGKKSFGVQDPTLDKNGFPSRKQTDQGQNGDSCQHQQLRTCCEICHARAAGFNPAEFEDPRGPTVDRRDYDWDYHGRKTAKNETIVQNTTTMSGDHPVKVSDLLDTVGNDTNSRQILATSGRFDNKSTIGRFSSIDTKGSGRAVNRLGNTYSSQDSARRTLQENRLDPAKTSLSVAAQDFGVPDPKVMWQLKEKHGENLIIEKDYKNVDDPDNYDQQDQGNFMYRKRSSQFPNTPSRNASQDRETARNDSKESQRKNSENPGIITNITQMGFNQARKSGNLSSSAAKRLMEGLTNGQASINDSTVLLMNGGEILNQKGINGDIAEVGLGFGTGRHTQSRQSYASKSPPRPPRGRAGTPNTEAFNAKASVYSKELQTSQYLMNDGRKYAQNEAGTDPVRILPNIPQQAAMCQTDALPIEPASDDDGGNPFLRPKSHNYAKRNFRRSQQGMRKKANESSYNDTSAFPHETAALPKLDITSSEEELRDWSDSKYYQFVKQIQVKTLIKRGLLDQKDDINTPPNQKSMTKNQMEQNNLNPNGQEIWTKDEIKNYSKLLRDMPEDSEHFEDEQIKHYIKMARTTIEVVVANMIIPLVMNKSFYRKHADLTKDNLMKLLFRAQKLYDAKESVFNVLRSIFELESTIRPTSNVWRVLQDKKSKGKLDPQYQNLLEGMLQLISRTLGLVDTFKTENKLYKKQFIFKEADYVSTLLEFTAVTNGFMELKSLDGCQMETTGNLTFNCERSDEEMAQDKKIYEAWFAKSLKVTGQMPLPEMKQAKPKSSAKQSRVAMALTQITVTKEKPDQKLTIRNISPTPSMHSTDSVPTPQSVRRNVPKWYDDEYDEDGNLVEKVIEKEEDKNALLRKKREADIIARKQREYDLYILNLPGDPGYDPTRVLPHSPKHIDEEIGLPRQSCHASQEEFDQTPLHLELGGDYGPAISKVERHVEQRLPPLSPSNNSRPMLHDNDQQTASQKALKRPADLEIIPFEKQMSSYGTKFKPGHIEDERDINGLPVPQTRIPGSPANRSMRSRYSEQYRSEFTCPHEVTDAIDQNSVIQVLSDQ